jgi:SAM-dependent methyltransferase
MNPTSPEQPLRLYSDLAHWWPVFSPPSHYVEEAADLLPTLLAAPDAPPRTMLELGCGGGSLAFHFKDRLQLTLTDRSPQMIDVSRAVNPECEHLVGDMRTLDLGRTFDLVFIHDAIMYLTDEASLRAAFATAARHCRPGGAVVVVPDCVTETFEPETTSGGEDGADGRALRYLLWTWDPDPRDNTFEEAFAFLLRTPDGVVSVDSDLHRYGVFPRASWLEWLKVAGIGATSRMDPWKRDVFVGRKRHE